MKQRISAWKVSLLALGFVGVVGCGPANQAGNAAGNAAGFVGNAVGNVAGTAGNAARWTGNATGNVLRGANDPTNWGFGGAAGLARNGLAGTQVVQMDPATKTLHVRVAGFASNVPRAGWNDRSVMAGTTSIAIPTGWNTKVSSPTAGTWNHTLSVVPYRNGMVDRTAAPPAGVAGRTATAPTGPQTGTVAGNMGKVTQGGRQVLFTATRPGFYAVVLAGPGNMNRVLDVINVSNQYKSPSIVTAHA